MLGAGGGLAVKKLDLLKNSFKFFATCGVCGSRFQSGRHIYDGKRLPEYDLGVCNICLDANRDGWALDIEPKILQHLKAKGLPVPKRNKNGLLPISTNAFRIEDDGGDS
jgi:hypothetical protein